MHSDELQMIDAAGRGDLRAATALVDRHYRAIFAFLRRLTAREDAAADLTQQTFGRVWSALARFAGKSSLSSWLHGIAYHVYQDWRRADHRLESRTEEWWEDCADGQPGPDARVADLDLASVVYAAVERLEPALRETVHLHYYQGLTLDETAHALDVATSTVKYRLRSAIQQLQGRLADRPAPLRNPPLSRQP